MGASLYIRLEKTAPQLHELNQVWLIEEGGAHNLLIH